MRLILILCFLLLSHDAWSFYLMMKEPPRYTGGAVKVSVIADGCVNIDLTSEDLREFAQESLDQYWNTVSSASIKFDVSETIELEDNLTVQEIADLVPPNEIVVACSTNTDEFSDTTLAKGGMQTNAAGKVQGLVVLNNTVGSVFNSLSRTQTKATFAHEFGHTMGIGHSNVSYALMYYAVDEDIKQLRLSEDDADALTYLYPNEKKMLGLLGSCATVNDIGSGPRGGGPLSFVIGLMVVIMIFRAKKILYSKPQQV